MATQNPTNSGTPTNGQNPYLDSLIWGNAQWSVSQADPITYSFGTGLTQGPLQARPGPFTGDDWSSNEIAAFQSVMANYSAVANVYFAPATSQDTANLVFWQLPQAAWTGDTIGFSQVPNGTRTQLNIWFNDDATTWAELTPGTIMYRTIIHELGHATGLAHPHDGGPNADSTTFPGVRAVPEKAESGIPTRWRI